LASRLPSRPSRDPKRRVATNPTALPANRRNPRAGLPARHHAPAADLPRHAALAFLSVIALLGSARAHAESEQALASFNEARAAFEKQDFSTALALYEQALAQGLEGPAVHFNIGVAAYRSGQLQRAERAFREVARTPAMAGLANYNLGLVLLKRGKQAEARRYFELASHDTDERLAALAARQLGELPAAASPPSWSLYGRTGAGYDDNVALRSESIEGTGTGEDDIFAELLFAGSVTFSGRWRVDTAAGWLKYADLDEFDQSAFSVGGVRIFDLDDWQFELGAYGNYLTLGGDVYEQSAAAAARVTRNFSGGRRLQAQFRATAVDGEGDFSGLTGSRTELGLRYDWSWQAWNFSAYTRGEINHADDEVFASRWAELGGTADYALSTRWNLTGGAALRQTRHPAQPAADIEESWKDKRLTVRLGAIAKYWKQAQLFIRYEHERNDSPIDFYEYDRNWIAASIEAWY
jgi:tetratricopeptide (TPR) repeat protein